MTTHRDALTLHVLASGSSGNASVVHRAGESILLDAGLSARQIVVRMESAGLDAGELTAIVITHEHSDHIKGVRVLGKRLGVPVYMTEGTAAAAERHVDEVDVHTFSAGESAGIGSIGVQSFRVEHDAREPVGYVFEDAGGTRIGVITDTGHLTPDARGTLQGCAVLGIECNHDVETLEKGPYPWFLKQRILSSRGHLSNSCAGEALGLLAGDGLRHVVALHISDTNNTAALAESAMAAALCDAGVTAPVTVCPQGIGPVSTGCE